MRKETETIVEYVVQTDLTIFCVKVGGGHKFINEFGKEIRVYKRPYGTFRSYLVNVHKMTKLTYFTKEVQTVVDEERYAPLYSSIRFWFICRGFVEYLFDSSIHLMIDCIQM